MPRRRARGVAKRMDAAIDHFTPMGYRKADVRSVVNKLLKVYGKDESGKDAWSLQEDGCYLVVQEALLEMQEEEEKLQLQVLQEQQQQQQKQLDEDHDGDVEGEEAQLYLQEPQQEVEEEEEAPQQEAAMMEEPLENVMPIVMVRSELPPSETLLAVEQTEEVIPMPIDPPSPRAAPPDPAATGTSRTRPFCYGWISDSESDSDYEEYLARRRQVHVPAE